MVRNTEQYDVVLILTLAGFQLLCLWMTSLWMSTSKLDMMLRFQSGCTMLTSVTDMEWSNQDMLIPTSKRTKLVII